MSTSDFQKRYAESSDSELVELVREGPTSYRPDAWSALCAEVARRQIPLADEEESAAPVAPNVETETAPPVGLGGWLAVFQAHQTLSVIAWIVLFERTVIHLASVPGAVNMGFSVAVIFGLYLIATRSSVAWRYWIRLLALEGVLPLTLAPFGIVTWRSAAASAFWTLIWANYWVRSKRVRATLGGPPTGTPDPSLAPAR